MLFKRRLRFRVENGQEKVPFIFFTIMKWLQTILSSREDLNKTFTVTGTLTNVVCIFLH